MHKYEESGERKYVTIERMRYLKTKNPRAKTEWDMYYLVTGFKLPRQDK